MLCAWCNFEGVIQWKFVPNGRAVDADLYSQQLERVHDILRWRYPALVNRNRVLLQLDSARPHTARTTMTKIQELGGIELLSNPVYSPDFAPSNCHLFRSMAHFLRGRNFEIWSCGSGSRRILRIKNQRMVPSRDNKPRWNMAHDHRIWWSLLWRVVCFVRKHYN